MHEPILISILAIIGLGTVAAFVRSKYVKIKNVIKKNKQHKSDIEWS
jgi:hypothetical protein